MTILENPSAAHQIRIRQLGREISISCTCLNAWTGRWRQGPGYLWPNPAWTGVNCRSDPIEVRSVFPAGEAIAAWRAWHAAKGVVV